jgi:hypothetical protein
LLAVHGHLTGHELDAAGRLTRWDARWRNAQQAEKKHRTKLKHCKTVLRAAGEAPAPYADVEVRPLMGDVLDHGGSLHKMWASAKKLAKETGTEQGSVVAAIRRVARYQADIASAKAEAAQLQAREAFVEKKAVAESVRDVQYINHLIRAEPPSGVRRSDYDRALLQKLRFNPVFGLEFHANGPQFTTLADIWCIFQLHRNINTQWDNPLDLRGICNERHAHHLVAELQRLPPEYPFAPIVLLLGGNTAEAVRIVQTALDTTASLRVVIDRTPAPPDVVLTEYQLKHAVWQYMKGLDAVPTNVEPSRTSAIVATALNVAQSVQGRRTFGLDLCDMLRPQPMSALHCGRPFFKCLRCHGNIYAPPCLMDNVHGGRALRVWRAAKKQRITAAAPEVREWTEQEAERVHELMVVSAKNGAEHRELCRAKRRRCAEVQVELANGGLSHREERLRIRVLDDLWSGLTTDRRSYMISKQTAFYHGRKLRRLALQKQRSRERGAVQAATKPTAEDQYFGAPRKKPDQQAMDLTLTLRLFAVGDTSRVDSYIDDRLN